MGLQFLQMGFCLCFFSFTVSFLLLSIFLFISRIKPWCNCHVCKTYLNSSWTHQFDNLCDWYTHLLQKSSTGTIHVHILKNIITGNPKNVEYILKTRFDNYPKGKQFSTILGDLLGHGIFNVDGNSWKFQRKMASLELGSVSVRSYAFETITNEIKTRLVPLLESRVFEGRVIDLQDAFRRFSFDTICKFSFGLDPGCLNLSLPVSEFATAFDSASRLSAQRAMSASPAIWKVKRLFNVGAEKELKRAIKLVDSLAEQVIKHKRETGFSSQDDLLSRFMTTVEHNDKYLRDIVVSFLLAGRDTVASSLTCFFWLLQENPDVVEKIRNESDRVMGQTRIQTREKELASYEEMQNMHYLQASVYESLRLYPPVQFDSKFCQDDDVLPDGTFVKKGTRVTYHPYAMGRMQSIWGEDCHVFKPERWLQDGDVFKPVNPFRYPVFQAGLRVCLGKDMALVEMKSIALALIRRFDFQVTTMNNKSSLGFVPGLTATVRGGLPVMVRARKSQ